MRRELAPDHPASPEAQSAGVAAEANPFTLLPAFERPRQGASKPGVQHDMDAMPAMQSGMADMPVVGHEAGDAPQPKIQYTCPMPSEVLEDEPGSCPKCGMQLRPVERQSNPHAGHDQ